MYTKIKAQIGSGLKAKIISGLFWNFIGTLISKGLIFFAFIYIARIISIEDYGKIGIIRSFILTFTLLSLGSLGATATKYLAIYKDIDKKNASKILSLNRVVVLFISIAILIFLLSLSKSIAKNFFGDITLSTDVQISAVAIFFSALNGLQTGALSGLEKFKEISYLNMINGTLTIPLLIFTAKYYGVRGVTSGLMLTNFLLWLTSAYILMKVVKKEKIYFTLRDLKNEFQILKDFSLPSFLGSLMISPIVLLCNAMLVHSTNGFTKMGIYNAAFNYSTIVLTMITIWAQVLYPYSMKMYDKNNKKFEFINIISPLITGIFLCLPLLVFPDFFSNIFGSKYASDDMFATTTFVAMFTIVIGYGQGISINFAAGNYMWWNLLHNFVWGLLSLIFCKLLIHMGAKGRALAFLLSYVATALIFLRLYIHKKIASRNLLVNWYIFYVIVILIVCSSFFYLYPNLIIRICLLLLAYFLFIKVFKKWWIDFVN